MHRREAIRLFRELSKSIPGMSVDAVSLTPIKNVQKEFELRINTSFDRKSLQDIQSVVAKHGLNIKEDKGTLLISGSRRSVELVL